MRLNEALYGVTNTGHGMREFSGDATSLARGLAWRMDLPGTAPAGIAWSPYVSGFAAPPYYVLTYTTLDRTAKRAGMVTTRALFAPLGEITTCENIESLMEILVERAEAMVPVSGFDIECVRPMEPKLSPAARACLAQSYLSAAGKPLVCLNEADFPPIAAFIWSRLWPEARSLFSFRLSFSAQDLPGLSIACTPSALRARWFQQPLFDPNTTPGTVGAAAMLFAGLPDADSIARFGGELGHEPTDLSDFRLLADAHRHWSNANFDSLVAAARLFGRLSPNRAAGQEIKAALMDQLATSVRQAAPSDLVKLANIDLAEIADHSPVIDAIEAWAINLLNWPIEAIGRLLLAAEDSRSVAPWALAVWRGLLAGVRAEPKRIVAMLWTLWSHENALLPVLLARLATYARLQDDLVSTAPPSITLDLADRVLTHAAERRWWWLHGVVAAASRPALEAIATQIAADPSTDRAGLQAAVARATGQEIIQAALRAATPGILQMAGEAAAAEPRLLRHLNVASAPWRAIWVTAMMVEPSTWSAPNEPEAAHWALFDLQIDQEDIEAPIFAALSCTPLANVLAYPRRAELWSTLEASARGDYLTATASGWLSEVTASGDVSSVEPALSVAIAKSDAFDAFERDVDPMVVIRTYGVIADLDETRFNRWIKGHLAGGGTLSNAAAADAGDLVRRRGWSTTARAMLPQTGSLMPSFLQTMVMGFVDLIDSSTRYNLNLWTGGAPQTADKWQVLEDLAAELYPQGPSQGGVWWRSSGSDADLPHQPSGRLIWREVLRQMRNGGGKVRVWQLLRAMAVDWPANHALQRLAREPEFAPPPPPPPPLKKKRK